MSTDSTDLSQSSDLVVIGSSAGGIEALSVLVSTLNPNFPAPIVIAQHLDPNRPSMLAPMLERRSTLPIVLVEEPTKLQPGTIYLVPSNQHVTIDDATVRLEGDHRERPRPSVDLLFSTAAAAYGDRLIAVILTGSGSDGAIGAMEVKKASGTVIIQNPDTARYPSMPLALPPTAVDHVADLDRIAALLFDIVTGTSLPEPPEANSDALATVLRIVSRHADIDFRQYKPTTILRRIGRRMAIMHAMTLQDYANLIEVDSNEAAELTMAFLIKVTEFFRDQEAFEFLREQVIPDLVARGRENGRVLRFWSAGCATGEEPYSLALLLAEALAGELPEWSIKIFATDIDQRAIDFARRGLYPAASLDNVPQHLVQQFFERAEGGLHLAKPVRQMVIFGQQDLSRAVPFPRIDLIVCRNLLIYFKPELQQQILDSFAYSLTKSGYLFLGKAETARPSKADFELSDKRWKIYRCVNCPLGIKPRDVGHRSSAISHGERRGIANLLEANEKAILADLTIDSEIGGLRRYNELVLRLLPVGVVVIDRSYRIVTISGAARRLLGVRELGIDQDFLHTVRGLPYHRVRSAIDTVFRERTAMTLAELELDPTMGGDGRYLLLNVVPIQLDLGTADLAVVSVTDATEQVQTRRRLEAVQAEQAQLVDELSGANKRLSDLNKELQDANEELQAANEELMLTQEELQASNEEFEATNEELQATNEELETNNEELQATNEELEATNDELTARTQELVQLTHTLEAEQARLIRVVNEAEVGVVVLRGPRLDVEMANARASVIFDTSDPRGHMFEEVFHGTEKNGVVDSCFDAYRKDQTRTSPAFVNPDDGNRQFAFRVVPTHDAFNAVDGLILFLEPVE